MWLRWLLMHVPSTLVANDCSAPSRVRVTAADMTPALLIRQSAVWPPPANSRANRRMSFRSDTSHVCKCTRLLPVDWQMAARASSPR